MDDNFFFCDLSSLVNQFITPHTDGVPQFPIYYMWVDIPFLSRQILQWKMPISKPILQSVIKLCKMLSRNILEELDSGSREYTTETMSTHQYTSIAINSRISWHSHTNTIGSILFTGRLMRCVDGPSNTHILGGYGQWALT